MMAAIAEQLNFGSSDRNVMDPKPSLRDTGCKEVINTEWDAS